MAADMPYYRTDGGDLLSSGRVGGGLGTSTLLLAKALVRRGVEVEIVAPGFKNCRTELDGVSVIWRREFLINFRNNLRIMGTAKSPLGYRKNRRIFYEILKAGGYDLYHAHSPQFSVGPVFAADEIGIPSVLTVHDFWPVCFTYELSIDGETCERCDNLRFFRCLFKGGMIQRGLSPVFLAIKGKSMAMRREALRRSDRIVTASGYVKSTLTRFGVQEGKIEVIPYIFDAQRRPAAESRPYLCWAGRIVKVKGLPFLISAFAEVVRKHPEVELYLIGDGDSGHTTEKGKLVGLIGRLGISEHVKFTGWLPYERTVEVISKSIALVLPSIWPEPFGRIILEAMGCGKPVIATDIGGPPELVIDGHNGMLVPPRDSAKLAEKICYLIENPEQAERMGNNGFNMVSERFNSDAIAAEHIRIYEDLAG